MRLRAPSISMKLHWVLLWWLVSALLRLPVALLRRPALLGVLAVAGYAAHVWTTVAAWPVLVAAGTALAGLVGWRCWRPDSFARRIVWRVRGCWRRFTVYRSAWYPAMATTKLTTKIGDATFVPELVSVRSTGTVDLVTIALLPGQVLSDFAEVGDRLAGTFGATDCRVRSHQRNRRLLVLWFLVNDPLTEILRPVPPGAGDPDLKALTVALREDGLWYRLRLLGTHLLIAGATGAGKSSLLWAILGALGPGIRSGLVQVWALDPKGGMELAAGRKLFARFCYGGDDTAATWAVEFANMLEQAVATMRARQSRLRGFSRLHKPTTDEPFLLIIVDELASLTGYVGDRDTKRRIHDALSVLLTQGRAAGVTVVGAVSDPRKEVLPLRDLFPTRIALRVTEPDQVRFALGDGARLRGARCDEIPESLPGVGFVTVDGIAEPVRARFAHLTDSDIRVLADVYEPVANRPHIPGQTDAVPTAVPTPTGPELEGAGR